MSYAELLCVSNFTFQRGASHASELIVRAKQLGYSALAITDECSLAGIVRAHEAAKQAGLKLIVGAQFTLAQSRIALLAPTQAAYEQLSALITRARRTADKGSYFITPDDFTRDVQHCIGLYVPAHDANESDWRWFAKLPLQQHCVACSHHLAQHDDQRLTQLQQRCQSFNLLPVAVGDVHYHERERRKLHDVLTAIRLGTTVEHIGRAALANGERHLRPISTLRKLFPESLLAASAQIADQCNFSLDQLRYQYPHELVPAGLTATEHLRALVEQGAMKRWPAGIPAAVRALLEKELSLIAELNYEAYFLTVSDIVAYARSQGILCQGRGSAANSAVCYALGVTEVDPSRGHLLFERFLSKERAEPPDIDIDFEHDRREEVIQYIYKKYGRERAALAATVICYRRRMAVRDVGKSLGFAPDVVDALCSSLQWFDGAQALPAELKRLGFDPRSPRAQWLITLVKQLTGFPRHLSQHVGGFVISEQPLSTLVPVENAAMPERTIIQWDKEDLESLGLLKVDCLALGMLSAIRRALHLVSQQRGQPFAMQDIPAEDKDTHDMLCRGESVGVFQVESRAQMSMLPRLQPRTFYDLVIQVAIVRPGPIQGGMVHPYLRRRQGLEPIVYPSEALKRVLERTCGVPLFQEQVMQIAMVAAGFSAGEADQVRRSMAAWQRKGGLEHFHDRLINGMLQRGYTREFAEAIYQQILGFGSYGFPESHAASFALLAYVSAWLKCHEPAAFVAGLINSWPMGFYAPAQLIAEAQRQGVCFLPIDVQVSDWECTLERHSDKPAVRLGLCRVSGVSEAQARKLLQARRQANFTSVDDLAHRAQLDKAVLQRLARAGALRSLVVERHAAQWRVLGVEKLPGMLAGHAAKEPEANTRPASEGQRIVLDYQSTGHTLERHPLELLRPRLTQRHITLARDLVNHDNGKRIRVAGIVTHRQRPQTASGVLFISLEDESGLINLIVWPKLQVQYRQVVLGAMLMAVEGQLQREQGVIHVVAHKLRDYSHWLGSLTLPSRDFQ